MIDPASELSNESATGPGADLVQALANRLTEALGGGDGWDRSSYS